MEDILASIKRIIAEDSEAVGARIPRPRRELAAVPSEPAPEPEDEPMADEPEAESADVLELTSPIPPVAASGPAVAKPAPIAAPVSEPIKAAPGAAEAVQAIDTLLSDPARQASRNAFASLSQLQVRPLNGGENTLEGLVADMLRPMLRDWLDRELPSLVERLVAAEIARVSGRAS